MAITEVDLERKTVRVGTRLYHYEEDGATEERTWTQDSTEFLQDGFGNRYAIDESTDIAMAEEDGLSLVQIPVRKAGRLKLLNGLVDEAEKKLLKEKRVAKAAARKPLRIADIEPGEDDEEPAEEAKRSIREKRDTEAFRVCLLDYSTGRCYVKTPEGSWGFVRWAKTANPRTGKKLNPTKRLERHRAAELNRQLLQMAVADKVEMPTKPPASFNKLWDSIHKHWTPINLVEAEKQPEDTQIFWRKQAVGTVSLKWLQRFTANLIRYCSERRLWEEKQGLKPTEGEEEDEQEESWETEEGEEEA
jgi:hypothetical protein